ncbi:hypothetical protein CTAYLR_004586 [Chrysophaeum taylorii]|uniref:subtilisin n=1 Tax=Chrysophaeum taylorii TaxID=2483200 RepID=A0AAD7XLX0_9STRA|nr:hypothetical protein CTAYLR_004586 [Chrysophaeum taylorii]
MVFRIVAVGGVVVGSVLLETRGPSRKWRVVADDDASPGELELMFFVKAKKPGRVFEVLEAVSNPKSASYGQHLSLEQVNEVVAPAAESIRVVREWAAAFGVTLEALTANGDALGATVSIGVAERMLACKYRTFEHEGRRVRRADNYSVPEAVAAVLDMVAPTVHLPATKRSAKRGSSAGYENTPKNLRELYSVNNETGKNATSVAVTAFLEEYYSRTDLESFWAEYCEDIVCGEGLPVLVGDATVGSPGVESMLDIETVTGMAGGVRSEFWGFSGRSKDDAENEPFLKWLVLLSNTSDPPPVFSTSYGEDEDSWSENAAARLNVEFAKQGVRGISLLFASGDEGANCEDGVLVPETPASSPYVTAVGGTAPVPGFPAPGSETAIGLSSGGVSNYWSLPSYQTNITYFANQTGRVYPDVAAQATDFCVTPFGCGVAGTSCACPTFAGVVALLNDRRLRANKSTLGFLNPFLYQNPDALTDITTGTSTNGCGGGARSTTTGWAAAPGWDAVTGLGTPDFSRLAVAVDSLP